MRWMVGHNQGGGRMVGGWVVDRFSASSVKAYQIVESEKNCARNDISKPIMAFIIASSNGDFICSNLY